MPDVMRQYAPYPEVLARLVKEITYRPGWDVRLSDQERDPASTHGHAAGGLTLVIFADVHDTYHPAARRPVNHIFSVPAATYNEAAWLRWLLSCYLLVEQHECCEWFKLGEGRPYAPTHGPGDDPYTIKELATDVQRRTSYQGVLSA